MSQVNRQGVLSNGSNIIFSANTNKKYKTGLLNFNSPYAYTITLKKFNSNLNSTVILIKLELDAGDTVVGTTEYFLDSKDNLIVDTTTSGVNYLVILNEI